VVCYVCRVTSYQQDWCQGSIQITPGKPQLLALEISYIFPIPAWFLHPCQKDDGGALSLDLRTGFGSYVPDPRYLEPNGHGGGNTHRGLDCCVLGGTIGKRPSKMAALLTRLLPGKGRGAARSRGGFATPEERPWYHQTCSSSRTTSTSTSRRLSYSRDAGSGSNRGYSSHSSSNRGHGSSGAQYGSNGLGGSSSSSSSQRCRVTCTGVSTSPNSSGSATYGKAGGLIIRDASAWLVPEDHEQRFKEGFLFCLEMEKLQHLLEHYNVLSQGCRWGCKAVKAR
jgi:hypothetical protein